MEQVEIICLEKILQKLTSVIQMYEFEDSKKLVQLCDVAVEVAAQLNYCRNNVDESENEDE